MTVGERIKEARLKKGYSQTELAELLGYKSRSSINKIEKEGRDIPRSSIVKLAKLLDVTPAYLMGWEETEQPLGNLQVLPNDKVYMIPVFDSVSAGFGAYACSDIKEYFPMYIDNPADAPDMLCLTVQGDSMYPKIEEGDMVAVRKQSSVDSGSVAVMLIDGEEGVVKKVNYGPDWIELISFNPMYPPRRFEGAEVQRLQVVGLVKKVIKNM